MFFQNDRRVISCADDKTVRIWDPLSGKVRLKTFQMLNLFFFLLNYLNLLFYLGNSQDGVQCYTNQFRSVQRRIYRDDCTWKLCQFLEC